MMLDMMSKELKDQDPVLTIRRNLQQVVQRHSHVHSLKQIIETILKIKLPCKTLKRDEDEDDDEESKELGEALRDGSLLCQLANALIPKSISNIYTPTNYKVATNNMNTFCTFYFCFFLFN
ncbi:hypothetical protein HELRODRAFT_173133 [Helobdella robusta]|uniref:Calponin-homology (CH) domain-containing protein n=1 Tax=Helobdella robusta TaxID=6412 RepID=T1F6F3_HELRO|nr:hypothetical protein HELRODRAFT_173133 [Helobdella robusta]ESO04059.1 hypothetical protein HELRODRAFT_173133 [Helobdella robusta]